MSGTNETNDGLDNVKTGRGDDFSAYRNAAIQENVDELAGAFESYFEEAGDFANSSDSEGVESILNSFIEGGELPVDDEENEPEAETQGAAPAVEVPPVVENTNADLERYKAELEELKAAKQKAEADRDLLVRALQAQKELEAQIAAEEAAQATQTPAEPKPDVKEKAKKKAKEFSDKQYNLEEDAADALVDTIEEMVKGNFSPDAIRKIVMEAMEEKTKAQKHEEFVNRFERAKIEFVSKNEEFLKVPAHVKLYNANFNELQNEYQSKGVGFNPEDLYAEALKRTQADLEPYAKPVASSSKSTAVKLSDSLQNEANKAEEAKQITPSNTSAGASTKVRANKFSQEEAWFEMQKRIGARIK